MAKRDEELSLGVADAVARFWQTRKRQGAAQRARGRGDQGSRTAVTGGRQMNGFVELLTEIMLKAGAKKEWIFYEKQLEVPGYFRAEKKWDVLEVREGELIAAIEAKSQVGPSFGNNFNNRTEEAIGSAVDLWTAYREGVLNRKLKPWLGYVFLLEDCPRSRSPVRVCEPHFKVMEQFVDASYAKRYEILCRTLARERHYDAAALLLSPAGEGRKGVYSEPASDLTFALLARSLFAHARQYAALENT